MNQSKLWQFKGLWNESEWISPAYVEVDQQGKISSLSTTLPKEQGKVAERAEGWAIPPLVNGHSHAFQYAMAGEAEHLALDNRHDDFWSWREAMYRVALRVDPEQVRVIATALYAEMIRLGYHWVVEFHYLHNDPNGKPYAHRAEMSQSLIQAADATGIGLTLVPVYYNRGGFGLPAYPQQRRFCFDSVDHYFKLYQDLKSQKSPRLVLGGGAHSLRAADPAEVVRIYQWLPPTVPKHIHAAEQIKEVTDCKSHLKTTPVNWLLDNVEINSHFSLVHATHINEQECDRLAQQKANVILCPSTEGNLGDGFFPISRYHRLGGSWAIGTDSHIGLFPFEELRWLDYGSRLSHRSRLSFCQEAPDDSGQLALQRCYRTGRRAAGLTSENHFTIGSDFDALVIRADHPLTNRLDQPHGLSRLIYGLDSSTFLGTLLRGQWAVKNGVHRLGLSFQEAFNSVLNQLKTGE